MEKVGRFCVKTNLDNAKIISADRMRNTFKSVP